jgi:hypothetical protein
MQYRDPVTGAYDLSVEDGDLMLHHEAAASRRMTTVTISREAAEALGLALLLLVAPHLLNLEVTS